MGRPNFVGVIPIAIPVPTRGDGNMKRNPTAVMGVSEAPLRPFLFAAFVLWPIQS